MTFFYKNIIIIGILKGVKMINIDFYDVEKIANKLALNGWNGDISSLKSIIENANSEYYINSFLKSFKHSLIDKNKEINSILLNSNIKPLFEENYEERYNIFNNLTQELFYLNNKFKLTDFSDYSAAENSYISISFANNDNTIQINFNLLDDHILLKNYFLQEKLNKKTKFKTKSYKLDLKNLKFY